jgi:hypothetical protein
MEETDIEDGNPSINSFYYTNERHIKKMDDVFILSKIQEKYPELTQDSSENILKSVITLIMNDTKYMEEIENEYNLNSCDILKIIYRNYEYVFNACFITKLQKLMQRKKYGRN